MSAVLRAQRFPIRTRVLCRRKGQEAWTEGFSVNVSRTGVLFQLEPVLPPGTPVEIILRLSEPTKDEIVRTLPASTDELPPADVLCIGRIVRTESRRANSAGPALAATIESYSFMHA